MKKINLIWIIGILMVVSLVSINIVNAAGPCDLINANNLYSAATCHILDYPSSGQDTMWLSGGNTNFCTWSDEYLKYANRCIYSSATYNKCIPNQPTKISVTYITPPSTNAYTTMDCPSGYFCEVVPGTNPNARCCFSICPAASTVQCGQTITPSNNCGICSGTGTFCSSGTCDGVSCVSAPPACTNQCPAQGEKQCVGEDKYMTCGDYNSDGCLEWGIQTDCPIDKICSNGECISPICGDNKCSSPTESPQNCLVDCPIPGWTAPSAGFALTQDNQIKISVSGKALITSYSLDLKADTNYILNVNIINPTNCNAYVDLDDGHCLSADDWTIKTCFDDLHVTGNQIINIPSNTHTSSDNYFKQLHLRLVVDGNCNPSAGILFDNVSLKESQYIDDAAYYNNLPASIDSTSGCCPKDWCWNGSLCVDSKLWMGDSQYSPVWNLLNVSLWFNSHINTTSQPIARGYRCVLDDSGNAQWTLSTIKYDWNYKTSGYCPKETDCFVDENFNDGTSGDDCIKDGESIGKDSQGNYIKDGGNNFCHQGKWTTKSYIIATALETLTAGNSFTLFCDDSNNKIFNNHDLDNRVASACTMIKKESANDERVYVGFALNKPDDYDLKNNGDPGFIGATRDKYIASFGPDTGTSFKLSLSECTNISGTDYAKCADESNLKLYYNTKYKYFILTNEDDASIEPTAIATVWNTIVSFFSRLFGIAASSKQYEYLNYTSKYDKIYVMKDNNIVVKGIEEMKYDEMTYASKNFLYLSYANVNVTSNKINLNYVNTSIQNAGGGNYNYTSADNAQEIIIKSDNPTLLFEYLTAMLRNR